MIENKNLKKVESSNLPKGIIFNELINFIADCLGDYEYYYIAYFLNNYLEYHYNLDYEFDYFYLILKFLINAKIEDEQRVEILISGLDLQVDSKYLSYMKDYVK